MNHEVNSKHYFVFKRILDLLISVVLLIFAFPVLVILSILVLIFIGKPVLFKQTRSGMNGDNFTIYKFRTMSLERDLSGNLLSDEFRMTTLGSFLRKSSLDELPQLYNVLKGDLSLVGPRPLLPEYNDLYSAFQKRRLSVVPGITGWAQINGRNLLSWDERFNLDV